MPNSTSVIIKINNLIIEALRRNYLVSVVTANDCILSPSGNYDDIMRAIEPRSEASILLWERSITLSGIVQFCLENDNIIYRSKKTNEQFYSLLEAAEIK